MYSVERETNDDYDIEYFDELEEALQKAAEWETYVEDDDGRKYWP